MTKHYDKEFMGEKNTAVSIVLNKVSQFFMIKCATSYTFDILYNCLV